MSHHHEDEDFASENTGYKVGQKKTVDEYQNLDANDESLNRWKESLGLNTGKPIYASSPLPHPSPPPRFSHLESLLIRVATRAMSKCDLLTCSPNTSPLVNIIAKAGNDPHNVVVLKLALEVAGRPDVELDLTQSGMSHVAVDTWSWTRHKEAPPPPLS